MLDDFLNKGNYESKYSKYFVTFVFITFCLVYIFVKSFNYNNYSQISIDVLMHLSFVGLVIFMLRKHGKWIILYVIASFLIISYSEIQSVWFLHHYAYLNWPSGILWTYPTTIGIGWIYFCYATYLINNILILGREKKMGFIDGDNYATGKPIYQKISLIFLLSFLDGILLVPLGVLNEAAGIDLHLWQYFNLHEPVLFGTTPTKTLFTYFLASFIFNLVFRMIEFIMNNYKDNKTLSMGENDIYPIFLIMVYFLYLIFELTLTSNDHIDHWSTFVSLPVIIFLLALIISRFYFSHSNNENLSLN